VQSELSSMNVEVSVQLRTWSRDLTEARPATSRDPLRGAPRPPLARRLPSARAPTATGGKRPSAARTGRTAGAASTGWGSCGACAGSSSSRTAPGRNASSSRSEKSAYNTGTDRSASSGLPSADLSSGMRPELRSNIEATWSVHPTNGRVTNEKLSATRMNSDKLKADIHPIKAQLMLTNPRDAFRGQSRSLKVYHSIDCVWFPISVL